jgi:N-acetylmuramoyl-L-alanine amidase
VRKSALQRAQRIIVLIFVAALAGIALLAAPLPSLGLFRGEGALPQGGWRAAAGKQIALISGHAGNDSGAVCEEADGTVTLLEADVNAAVVQETANRLRSLGAFVTILDEFDPRLQGLRSDLLLSIHADSCVDASGYKAASHSIDATDDDRRLVACINRDYAAATGLPHHPNTVTHNMTEYHAFGKIAPSTPAAILELGFLGGDRDLLENHPDVAAQGVADGLLCFLRGEDPDAPPTPLADDATAAP